MTGTGTKMTAQEAAKQALSRLLDGTAVASMAEGVTSGNASQKFLLTIEEAEAMGTSRTTTLGYLERVAKGLPQKKGLFKRLFG